MFWIVGVPCPRPAATDGKFHRIGLPQWQTAMMTHDRYGLSILIGLPGDPEGRVVSGRLPPNVKNILRAEWNTIEQGTLSRSHALTRSTLIDVKPGANRTIAFAYPCQAGLQELFL